MTRCLVALSTLAVAVALVANAVAGSRYLHFHVKSPVPRGALADVVVQGPAGLCRITVSKGGAHMSIRTRSGRDPLAPISTAQAPDGRVAWQWHVPTDTPLGVWQVGVSCGRSAPLHGTMLVTG